MEEVLLEQVEEEINEEDQTLTQQARNEAEEELRDLYGFDFEEIAVRNDEALREDPRNDIKKDLKKRDRYNKILDISDDIRPYAPEASFGAMFLTALAEGAEPALGDYSATLAVGGAACAALYAFSFALQKADSEIEPSGYTVLDDDSALEFVEEMGDVRVDGNMPYTFATGEEAAADLDNLRTTGDTVAVARSYEDGKKEVTLLQDNYPSGDESPEFEAYTISGFAEEPLPEGQPSEDNWDILKETVDAGEYIEFSETGWPGL